MVWTEKRDAELRELASNGYSSAEIALRMGKTKFAIKRRCVRVGIRIYRPGSIVKNNDGHKAFTPRCAELLRKAGVIL